MKTSRPKTKTSRLTLVLYLVAGLLILAATLSIHQSWQISNDRKLFAQAEQEVKNIHEKIAAGLNRETTSRPESYCLYSSQKYGKGSLSCTVKRTLIFSGVDEIEATELMQRSSGVLSAPLMQRPGPNDLQGKFQDANTSPQFFSQEWGDSEPLSCAISYVYIPRETLHNQIRHEPHTLLIEVWCGGSAKAEHYPLRD